MLLLGSLGTIGMTYRIGPEFLEGDTTKQKSAKACDLHWKKGTNWQGRCRKGKCRMSLKSIQWIAGPLNPEGPNLETFQDLGTRLKFSGEIETNDIVKPNLSSCWRSNPNTWGVHDHAAKTRTLDPARGEHGHCARGRVSDVCKHPLESYSWIFPGLLLQNRRRLDNQWFSSLASPPGPRKRFLEG